MTANPLTNIRQRCIDLIANEIRSNVFNYYPDTPVPELHEAQYEAEKRIDAMSNLQLLTLIEEALTELEQA